MSSPGQRRDPPEDRRAPGDPFSFVEDGDSADVLHWLSFAESRADRRQERMRRFRARIMALGVVVGLVAAGFGGWFVYGALTSASDAPDAGNSILFQVADPTGNAIASALLVADPAKGSAVALAVPDQLDVDVTGQGVLPFGQALGQLGPAGCRQALSDLLGVRIGGSWDLTAISFASLIDQAGGVAVTVDAPFPGTAGTVAPGKQQLSGADATLFAAQQRPGQPPSAATGRFLQVLDSLFGRMVATKSAMTTLLNRIGMVPDPSLSQDQLATALPDLASSSQNNRLVDGTLPVIPAPDTTGQYSLDVAGAGPMVHQLLGGTVSAVQSGGPPRVLLEDGTNGAPAPNGPASAGSPSPRRSSRSATSTPSATATASSGGWPTLAANAEAALTGAGMVVVDGGRPPGGQLMAHTTIQITDPAKRNEADLVAQALGLDDNAVQVVTTPQLTDVVVILGEDFQ